MVEPRVPKDPISRSPLKLHPLNRNKHIEAKIADLNKRLRRVRQNNIRSALTAKRDMLKRELNWGLVQVQRVFNGAYRSYRIAGYLGIDPNTFFTRIRKMLVGLIQKETTREVVRMQATMWIKFRKGAEMVNLAFNSRTLAAYRLNDIDELVNGMIGHMLEQVENPALRDSGFAIEKVIETNVDFHRLNLTRGSSYLPLPEWLSNKKAIINPKNNDMECFKCSVIIAKRWEEIGNNPERVNKLKRFESEYDWTDIEYPFTTRYIGKFEKNNKILVNILAGEGERIYILRKSKYDYRNVNLMLITGENSFPDEMWKHNRKHYVAIKSLSRLLTKANTKHNGNQHHCTNCLHGFPMEISKINI